MTPPTSAFTLLLALTLIGCSGPEPTDKDATDDTAAVVDTDLPPVDADGDGYVAATDGGDDCDDTDAAVHPDAQERCGGGDEDCDGAVDDADDSVDPATLAQWYADADADGYGDAAAGYAACEPASGSVAEAGDCDDAHADVNPDATEVCDALDVDEDCSGAADDADAGASGTVTWHLDADADGWGGEASGLRCDALPGETANAGDCDDADAARNGDDADGDGASTCDGDCDDDDASTVSTCAYTSMSGAFDVGDICAFDLVGVALATPVACPSCEFAFDTTGTLTAGKCISTFYGELGWDADAAELSFSLSASYGGPGFELGPFAGTLTTGADYDTIEWAGYGFSVYSLYEGTLFLYR